MNKKTKLLGSIAGGFLSVVIGVFAFFMMVAAPYVIGSNVDPITKSISVNAPIRVTFSSFMNHQKTEEAFSIKPDIKGVFSWQNNTLIFTPREPFKIGDYYSVVVGTMAENVFGKKLSEEYWAEFIVQGPPEVVFSAPQDITVGQEVKVVVMFNQPMVTMTELDTFTSDHIQFSIIPETQGQIRWIDTSSFEFVPTTRLLYASKYTVTIGKGTQSLDGGRTENDYRFSFETIHPTIVTLDPVANYDLAGPTTPLRIYFNQPMDLATLEKEIHITPQTAVSYAYDDKDSNVVVLQPKDGLQLKTDYTITIGKNVKGMEGDYTLGEDVVWTFKTVGDPFMISSDPVEGQKDADVYGINLYFSNPMDKESFTGRIHITPKVDLDLLTDSWESSDTTIFLTGDLQYSTAYTLRLDAGVKDKFGQVIGKDIVLSFMTKDRDPYLKIARKDYFNLFNGYQDPIYPLKTINLDQVDAYFCQMTQKEYIKRAFSYDSNDPKTCIEKKSWQIKTKGEKNKTQTSFIDFNELLGHHLSPGIYYVSISSLRIPNEWERKDYVTFFVSKTALTMKIDKEKVLIWATDLASGLPVSALDISLLGGDGKMIAQGKTNEQGLYQTPLKYEGNFYVIGKREGDIAFLSRWWSNGISTWDFGYNSDYRAQKPVFVYLYTDRPIYRPEQKVYFKGILRVDNDARFSIPDMKEFPVVITDAIGNEVSRQNVMINAMGTFHGEFLLDKNATLGQYQVYADVGDNNFYQDFYVEEYRKPEFKVDISSQRNDYTDGDTLDATIMGNYYFGGALKNKPVKWTINTSDYYFSDYEGEWYSFTDSGGFWYCYEGCEQQQSFVTSGEGVLDDNGRIHISIPLSLKEKKVDQVYTLEGTIDGGSNQTVSNRIPIYVHKSNYYVGVRSEDYVLTKGDNGNFKVIVLDLNKKPVQNKKVNVALYERVWNQVQKKNIDGEYYTEYEPKDTLLSSKDVFTDAQGKGSGNFSFPEGGEMVLKATLVDEKNRTLISTSTLYVSDNIYISWFSGNDSKMDLIPDQQEYAVGDTAKILVKSPFEHAQALVTYERRNIFEQKVIELEHTSTVIDVPITDHFIPNAYISVIVMKGGGMSKVKISDDIKRIDQEMFDLNNNPDADPSVVQGKVEKLIAEKNSLSKQLALTTEEPSRPDYRVGYTNLHVNTDAKKINIDLTMDQARYKPGTTVQVSIKTTDAMSKPKPSEVSLAVVDESVLALKTKEEDILGFFYGKKDLGVETSSSMSIFTDTVQVKSGHAKGGGGGGELPPNVRGNFKDTAFYKADIVTDASGVATASFTLPDNLTTWKVIAVAVDKDTLVGSGTTQFMATKELLLRPVTPRILRVGDEVEIGAIIQNGQTNDDVVNASLQIQSGDGTITSSSTSSVSVAKDKEQKVHWNVRVGKEGNLSFLFTAKGQKAEDSVLLTLPVLSYATPEVVATSGETDQSRTEVLRFSNAVANNKGNVSVTVYSSLLTDVTKGLDQVIHYPYGCAEQVMSTLLAMVSTSQMFEKLQLPFPDIQIEKGTALENEKLIQEKDPKKKIDGIIEVGLQKIYSFQRSDGGWGYWADSRDSYGYLSAYELFGLQKIKDAGYRVDEKVMQRGIEYLRNYISSHSIRVVVYDKYGKKTEGKEIDLYKANERAFILYILAELGKGDIGLLNNLYDVRSKLHLYARGYLLQALQIMHESEKSLLLTKELLSNMAEDMTARTAHFEESNNDYYAMNTDLRTTAIITQALIQGDKTNPVISKLIRYLVHNKTYDRMVNTQEITYTLFALNDYLSTVMVDPEGVGSKVHIGQEKVIDELLKGPDAQKTVVRDIADFIGKNQEVTIEKTSGGGGVYYDVVARYFLPIIDIAPRNNGMTVKREYYAFADEKEKMPLSAAHVGDVLRGKLTVIVPKERSFVVVESHLPAGLEAVNFNLETSEQELSKEVNKAQQHIWGDVYWKSGLWRFNHIETRDDRVVLFADYLPAGVYEYEYVAQVTSKGIFANPPVVGYEMYFPEIFGRGKGEIFTVSD